MNEKTVLNQTEPTKKKNGILPKLMTSVLGFLLIAIYLLTDRYLIEHVEMEVAVASSQPTQTVVSAIIEPDHADAATTEVTFTDEAEIKATATEPATSDVAITATAVSEPEVIVNSDEAAGIWIYQDAAASITIQRVTHEAFCQVLFLIYRRFFLGGGELVAEEDVKMRLVDSLKLFYGQVI